MQICMLNYDEISPDGKTVYLDCYGIGTFDVLSGLDVYLNHFEDTDRGSIAIPPGTYWVTAQPAGSLYYRIRAREARRRLLHHHADGFTLLRANPLIRANGMSRDNFRLHPLNPDDTVGSPCCITLRNDSDFRHLRRLLLKNAAFPVPGGKGLMAYARVDVCGTPDFSQYTQALKEKDEGAESARKSHLAMKLKEAKGE